MVDQQELHHVALRRQRLRRLRLDLHAVGTRAWRRPAAGLGIGLPPISTSTMHMRQFAAIGSFSW
jgi:hypothetical protein